MREWYVMHGSVEDSSEPAVWNCRMTNFADPELFAEELGKAADMQNVFHRCGNGVFQMVCSEDTFRRISEAARTFYEAERHLNKESSIF